MSQFNAFGQGILEPEKDFEIELSKQPNKRTPKFSSRTVEVGENSNNQPTLRFKKDGKVKEEYDIKFVSEVSEVRHSESTNLIQLVSSTNDVIIIRTRTKATKERWIKYLKSLAQIDEQNVYEENEYEEPIPEPYRRRAPTADNHLVRRQKTTPRNPENTQSVVNSQTTIIPPTPVHGLLDSINEGECDMAYPLTSTDGEPSSPRWGGQGATGGVNNTYYNYEAPHEVPTVIVNINVKQRPTPVPQRRNASMKRNEPTREGEEGEWPKPVSSKWQEESRPGKSPVPLPRRVSPPARRINVEELNAALLDRKGVTGGESFSPTERSDSERSSTGTRQVRDHVPPVPSPQEDEEESHYQNIRLPGLYVERMPAAPIAAAMPGNVTPRNRCRSTAGTADDLKREQEDGTIVHNIARRRLQEVGMRTMSSGGVWINGVPDDLTGILIQGDKITNINEQRIFDEKFARGVVDTSDKETIKVTIQRLPKGHVIEIERKSPGDPLGFQLDGTQITSVTPGSPFAKQLGCAALAEELCLTHLNEEYVPFRTKRNQVNLSLREAGLRFFIILQPLDFLKELTRRW